MNDPALKASMQAKGIAYVEQVRGYQQIAATLSTQYHHTHYLLHILQISNKKT